MTSRASCLVACFARCFPTAAPKRWARFAFSLMAGRIADRMTALTATARKQEDTGMKTADRFLAALLVAVAVGSLAGCATHPSSADGRLQFPQLDGKKFYRVILGNSSTPADFIFYFLRGEGYVFSLSLAVPPGSYE